MAIQLAVPVVIAPEVAACVAERRLADALDRLLEHVNRTVVGLVDIEVYLDPSEDPGDDPCIVVLAGRPESLRKIAPLESELNDWRRQALAYDDHRYFYLALAHGPGDNER